MNTRTISSAFTFAAIIFLIACGGNSDKKDNTGAPGDTAPPVISKPDTLHSGNTRLECRELPNDSLDIPHNLVVLVAAGKETIIDTVNTCSPIAVEEYKRYGIPGSAISACGGWYAGGGDYFYLLLRDGKPVIFAGWQDEGQDDDGYHWEQMKDNR